MTDYASACNLVGCGIVLSLEILYPVGKVSLVPSDTQELEEAGEGDGLLVKGMGSRDVSGRTVWHSSTLRKCMFLMHILSTFLLVLKPSSWFGCIAHGLVISALVFIKLSLYGFRDRKCVFLLGLLLLPVLARAVFMVAIDVYGVVYYLSKSSSSRSASASFIFLALTFLSQYFLFPAILLATIYSISTEQRSRLLIQDEQTPWETRCLSWKEFSIAYFTAPLSVENNEVQEA